MRMVFPLSIRIAVVVCLGLALGGISRAAEKPKLAGHWDFNQEQSDDARQKVQDARQNSADARRDPTTTTGGTYPSGGTYPGTGYPAGRVGMGVGGIGWPIGGGIGRTGRTSQGRGDKVSSQTWDELAANPNYLRIDQHDDRVVISDDADHTRTFYPDGKKHEDKDANGKKTSTKTDWNGDSLVAESKLGRSGKLTETYRVTADGKQLYVISQFEDSSLAGPVSIRRVYDLQKAAAAK